MHIFHWQGCIHVFCHFWWLTTPTWSPEAWYDLDITLGCVWSLWEFTWYYFNHFWPFAMFFYLILNICGYLWLIAPSMNYLCIPHNIVYLFDVFLTFSDLLLSFHCYQYSDLLIIYNFGWYYSARMPFSTPHRSSCGTCIGGSILNCFSQNLAQMRPFEIGCSQNWNSDRLLYSKFWFQIWVANNWNETSWICKWIFCCL
jgi:hypothetical protein